MRQIRQGVSLLLIAGAVAAAQTVVTSQTIDASAGDSAAFMVNVGPIAAGGTLKVKIFGGEAANGSDKAQILDAVLNLTVADANKKALIDIHRPTSKYLTVVVERAVGDSALVSIEALLFGAYDEPVEQPQLSQYVALVSPELA